MTLLWWRRNNAVRACASNGIGEDVAAAAELLRVSAEAKEEAVNGNVTVGRERANVGARSGALWPDMA